jgi:hypothetical protein
VPLKRALLSLIALVAAIFLAGVLWGHGSLALVYLSPFILAIWFSDRTILRRVTAAACGVGLTLLAQFFLLGIALGISVYSKPSASAIGPLLVQVAAAWVGYWVTKELLRSNPAAHPDAREASDPVAPSESRAGGRER